MEREYAIWIPAWQNVYHTAVATTMHASLQPYRHARPPPPVPTAIDGASTILIKQTYPGFNSYGASTILMAR
jgi:hypothetical protein